MLPVAVVIPSYCRFEKLRETLDAILKQTLRPELVIVVDDGSPDGSAEKKKEYLASYALPSLFLEQKNAGASAATNRGVEAAGDRLVVLFDDDIIPEPDTIERHVKHHETYPGSMLSGAANTDPARVKTDVERYKLYMESIWRKVRPEASEKNRVGFENFITTTANLSIHASDFRKAGGFDVNLRDGYDVDFGLRVLEKNIPCWFDGTLNTIHNDSITLRYYAKRQRAYAEAKKIIYDRHPELRDKLPYRKPEQPGWMKRFIYALLRRPAVVNFTERSVWMKIFPKSLRYRIYGSTIAALSIPA